MINQFYSDNSTGKIYVIDDKPSHKLHICKDGEIIKSYNVTHGANDKTDAITTRVYENGKVQDNKGNMSTSAGIYFLSRGNYHNVPSFIRRSKQEVQSGNPNGVPSSIHVGDTSSPLRSNGCTRMTARDLKDMAKYITEGTPCYVIPYLNKQNKFFVRNGRIQYSTKERGSDGKLVGRDHIDMVINPIKRIVHDKFDDKYQKQTVKDFSQTIMSYKSQLCKDLGINGDTYDQLAKMAYGILGNESTFGSHSSFARNLLSGLSAAVNIGGGRPDYDFKYNKLNRKENEHSVGPFQIRLSTILNTKKTHGDKVINITKKYGINSSEDLMDTKKATIAAMVLLATNYKSTGDIEKAVRMWNSNAKNYYNNVVKNSRLFEIYTQYKKGGKMIIKGQRGLIMNPKNRILYNNKYLYDYLWAIENPDRKGYRDGKYYFYDNYTLGAGLDRRTNEAFIKFLKKHPGRTYVTQEEHDAIMADTVDYFNGAMGRQLPKMNYNPSKLNDKNYSLLMGMLWQGQAKRVWPNKQLLTHLHSNDFEKGRQSTNNLYRRTGYSSRAERSDKYWNELKEPKGPVQNYLDTYFGQRLSKPTIIIPNKMAKGSKILIPKPYRFNNF